MKSSPNQFWVFLGPRNGPNIFQNLEAETKTPKAESQNPKPRNLRFKPRKPELRPPSSAFAWGLKRRSRLPLPDSERC